MPPLILLELRELREQVLHALAVHSKGLQDMTQRLLDREVTEEKVAKIVQECIDKVLQEEILKAIKSVVNDALWKLSDDADLSYDLKVAIHKKIREAMKLD